MRVGILTFFKENNYGSVLQAYALQTIIEGLGHEVCFIDDHDSKGNTCKKIEGIKFQSKKSSTGKKNFLLSST